MRSFRATLWYSLAFILWLSSITSLLAQLNAEIEYERRFTSLETTAVTIARDIAELKHELRELKSLKDWEWAKSGALGLLVAAEGSRAYRRRKGLVE